MLEWDDDFCPEAYYEICEHYNPSRLKKTVR